MIANWGKRLFAGAAMLFALEACSTLAYQEPSPDSGPVARVRFVTTSKWITVLRVYDDPDCNRNETEWMRLIDSWLARPDPKSLDMPLWHFNKNAAKEVYVAAGRQMNAMFFGAEISGTTTTKCATPFFYTFEKGHDYEVAYEWLPGTCRVRVAELVQRGQDWTLVQRASFDNALSDANRGCMEAFDRTRLY